MLLSVVIPCYNVSTFIDHCLISLIDDALINKQEIICVNDGSTDNTLDILMDWQKKYPNIIKIINISHSGLAVTRNKGLENATGKWIFFCDADDYITKGALSEIIKFLSSSKYDDIQMVNFGMRHCRNYDIEHFSGVKNVDFDGSSKDFFLKYISWTVWVFLYRLDYLKKHSILFHEVLQSEDGIFNAELLLCSNFRVLVLDADVYRYVYRSDSLSRKFIKAEAPIYIQSIIKVYSAYHNLICKNETLLNDREMYFRTKWYIAKQLPALFSRLLHSDLSISEYKRIREKLIELGAIPFEVSMEWHEKLKEWLVFHPVFLRVLRAPILLYTKYKHL